MPYEWVCIKIDPPSCFLSERPIIQAHTGMPLLTFCVVRLSDDCKQRAQLDLSLWYVWKQLIIFQNVGFYFHYNRDRSIHSSHNEVWKCHFILQLMYCLLCVTWSDMYIVLNLCYYSIDKCTHHNYWIWVRSWNCSCLVTWFCYHLIAKPGNKTAAVLWPDPYIIDGIDTIAGNDI